METVLANTYEKIKVCILVGKTYIIEEINEKWTDQCTKMVIHDPFWISKISTFLYRTSSSSWHPTAPECLSKLSFVVKRILHLPYLNEYDYKTPIFIWCWQSDKQHKDKCIWLINIKVPKCLKLCIHRLQYLLQLYS